MRLHESNFPYISRRDNLIEDFLFLWNLQFFPLLFSNVPKLFMISTCEPQNHRHISNIIQTKQVTYIQRKYIGSSNQKKKKNLRK